MRSYEQQEKSGSNHEGKMAAKASKQSGTVGRKGGGKVAGNVV